MNPKAAWLTVNRRCNFKCLWCYAEGTNHSADSDMRFSTALRLINISLDVGIKDFIILGGEPTFWPHLYGTCDYLAKKEAEATIVTNGWKFADLKMAKKAKETGAKINISVKAGNPNQYQQVTKVNAYARTLQAISNFAKLDYPASVSLVASAVVADNLEELVKVAMESGASNIVVEFCATTFDNGKPSQGYMLPPQEMAKKMVEKYDLLDKHSNGQIAFMQTLPFCLYPEGFLEDLIQKGHLLSGCHVFHRSGVIFTHDGGVLMCNCLHDAVLGKLDVDFNDTESFNQFWHREEVIKANEQLVCYPHRKCIECPQYDLCGGGCPLQWFVFNPELIQESRNVTRFVESADVNRHYANATA